MTTKFKEIVIQIYWLNIYQRLPPTLQNSFHAIRACANTRFALYTNLCKTPCQVIGRYRHNHWGIGRKDPDKRITCRTPRELAAHLMSVVPGIGCLGSKSQGRLL